MIFLNNKLILHLFFHSHINILSLSFCSLPVLSYFASSLLFFSLLFSSVLFPLSDIQTLPRVYFFDSYASLQTNGSESSRFILQIVCVNSFSLISHFCSVCSLFKCVILHLFYFFATFYFLYVCPQCVYVCCTLRYSVPIVYLSVLFGDTV